MSDCGLSGEGVEVGGADDFGQETGAFVGADGSAVPDGESGAFLASVLDGVESEVSESSGLVGSVDAAETAEFVRPVVREGEVPAATANTCHGNNFRERVRRGCAPWLPGCRRGGQGQETSQPGPALPVKAICIRRRESNPEK